MHGGRHYFRMGEWPSQGACMTAFLYENAILVALVWMLLANLFAVGPNVLKTPALVVMLLTWAPIIIAVIDTAGWLVGFPILILMFIQMRWAVYFIRRLLRSYGLLSSQSED